MKTLLCKEQLLITRDFNIHVDAADQSNACTWESQSVATRNTTNSCCIDGHILDLIITRSSDNIIQDHPYVDRFISDGTSVLCNLPEFRPAITVKKMSYRKIKSVNLQLVSLQSDLSGSSLCSDSSINQGTDLDNLVPNYNNTLSKVIDVHAPLPQNSDSVPEDLEVDDIQTFSDLQLLTEDDVNSLTDKSQ